MRAYLITFCFMLLGSTLYADTLPAQMNLLNKNDYFTYEKSNGEIFTQIFKGKKNGLYVVEVREGISPNGIYLGEFHTDESGQNVLRIGFGTGTQRFIPHDCRRTMGTCKYSFINGKGQKFTNTIKNKRIKFGFKMSAFDSKNKLYQKRVYVVDGNGFAQKFTVQDTGEKKFTFKLIQRAN